MALVAARIAGRLGARAAPPSALAAVDGAGEALGPRRDPPGTSAEGRAGSRVGRDVGLSHVPGPGHRPGHPHPRRPAELHPGATTRSRERPPNSQGAGRARRGGGAASPATDPQPGRSPAACRPPARAAAPRQPLCLRPPSAPAELPAAPPRALCSGSAPPRAIVGGPPKGQLCSLSLPAPLRTPGRQLLAVGTTRRRQGAEPESRPRRVFRAPGYPSSPGLGGAGGR